MSTTDPRTTSQASTYQQLRGHLATLKLTTAAEQLPAVLDAATAQGLSLTAALERLLAAEVEATQARRLAGRLRFACLPSPATIEDFDYEFNAIVHQDCIVLNPTVEIGGKRVLDNGKILL